MSVTCEPDYPPGLPYMTPPYECPSDDPANRPSARSGIHCYTGEEYPNAPDCSDATTSNPVGGPAVPPGKYTYYRDCWYSDTTGCVNQSQPQLQYVCALNPEQYPGDEGSLVACCIGQGDPLKCKPGYCPGSRNCAGLMSSLCAGARFAPGREPACLAWCLSRGQGGQCGSTPGPCDASAVDYCVRTGGGDTPDGKAFCACISAPEASIPGADGIPPCFDAACVTRGYKTASMLGLACHCPQFCQAAINCYQGHGSSCNISGTTFSGVCGGSLPPGPPLAPVVPPAARRALLVLAVVGVFLLLLALALTLAARAKKKGGPSAIGPAADVGAVPVSR